MMKEKMRQTVYHLVNQQTCLHYKTIMLDWITHLGGLSTLFFKMSSEYHFFRTVDHTNKLRGGAWGTITTRSLCDLTQHTVQHDTTQTLQIVLKTPIALNRALTTHVHWCLHNFWPAKSHDNISCLALEVVSTFLWEGPQNTDNGLDCHPNTMSFCLL
jgi:hypothetical protein